MGPTKWREGDRQRLRSTARIDRACRTWSSGSDFILFFIFYFYNPIGGRADAVRGDGVGVRWRVVPAIIPVLSGHALAVGGDEKGRNCPTGFVPLSQSVSPYAWAGSGYG